MNFENILYEEADGIAEITICRPEKRNAMTGQMFADLRQCWDRFDGGDARVAILKACDDKVFSAGADLNDPPELFWHAVPEFGFRCDKPIIAAISGKAIGAGMVLAMMCDFIVLTVDAELIYPEAKIGVAKGAVSALVKRGPLRVVQEMMLLGDPISAQRAHECGMANRLVAPGTHVDEARKLARRIADNAPLVVEMLKRMSLDAVGDTPIQTLFDVTRKVDTVMNSQDAADALEAFRNKRAPVFHGR
ncbi:enoyl-CoA hydratase/isomerase family protein [Roseinatronobacter sp. S2]|uniref:enoyl-CoA hydratase/isomerase family protein n=1 Tax=Roseinatronobacter sp. S2 TaxID=3035471 RepID=UPI0024107179|nr:enoyl-CoA hydratase-related protein [Roseinatronobacter sp. S2]WFE76654.1 enoyl-CoA hydratase-related protein [Roseinatronobacter sp. S2]